MMLLSLAMAEVVVELVYICVCELCRLYMVELVYICVCELYRYTATIVSFWDRDKFDLDWILKVKHGS